MTNETKVEALDCPCGEKAKISPALSNADYFWAYCSDRHCIFGLSVLPVLGAAGATSSWNDLVREHDERKRRSP